MLELNWRRRKNCECRPLSPPVVGQQRLSWILILNCKSYHCERTSPRTIWVPHTAVSAQLWAAEEVDELVPFTKWISIARLQMSSTATRNCQAREIVMT